MIYAARADGVPPDAFVPLLDEERIRYCAARRREADRIRCLAAGALRNWALARATGIPPRELRFGRTPHGKPFLLDRPGIHFNLAHAGPWVGIALGGAPVGLDIEDAARPIARPARLAARLGVAADAAAPDAARRLVRAWMVREAVGKALGLGVFRVLRRPLPPFRIARYRLDDRFEAVLAAHEAPPAAVTIVRFRGAAPSP